MAKLSQKIITVYPANFGEAFVVCCNHKHSDNTIYIASDRKGYWRKTFKKHDERDVMASIISHEVLHLVLTKIEGTIVSSVLDTLFGHGQQYKNEYHGLCHLGYRLRDYGKR